MNGKNKKLLTYFLLSMLLLSCLHLSMTQLSNIKRLNKDILNNDLNSKNSVDLSLISHYPPGMVVSANGLVKQNNYIYSSLAYNLSVIDVTQPNSPKLVSKYNESLEQVPKSMTFHNNFLYVGDFNGLTIYNVSNPTEILEVSQYNITGYVRSIKIQENLAYLAVTDNGLVIINITNPFIPEEIGQYKTNLSAWDIFLKNDYAYIANANTTGGQLAIIDVSNPQNPTLVGNFTHPQYIEMTGISITINETLAFLGTSYHGLFILNITNALQPEQIGHYYGDTEGFGEWWSNENIVDVIVDGTILYVAAYKNVLHILDVSNPSKPQEIGGYSNLYKASRIALDGSYLYVQSESRGVVILKISSQDTTSLPIGILISAIVVPIVGVGMLVIIIYLKRKNE